LGKQFSSSHAAQAVLFVKIPSIENAFPSNTNIELLVGIPLGEKHLKSPDMNFVGLVIRIAEKLETLADAHWWKWSPPY
jgi:hypothetical protein